MIMVLAKVLGSNHMVSDLYCLFFVFLLQYHPTIMIMHLSFCIKKYDHPNIFQSVSDFNSLLVRHMHLFSSQGMSLCSGYKVSTH